MITNEDFLLNLKALDANTREINSLQISLGRFFLRKLRSLNQLHETSHVAIPNEIKPVIEIPKIFPVEEDRKKEALEVGVTQVESKIFEINPTITEQKKTRKAHAENNDSKIFKKYFVLFMKKYISKLIKFFPESVIRLVVKYRK